MLTTAGPTASTTVVTALEYASSSSVSVLPVMPTSHLPDGEDPSSPCLWIHCNASGCLSAIDFHPFPFGAHLPKEMLETLVGLLMESVEQFPSPHPVSHKRII
jgi:hypothetical protein